MTYLSFLLLFLVPPLLWLAATQPKPLAGRGGLRPRLALPLVALIAFAYTTPWDNYLVFRQVWWYGPERVIGTLGYVPYEEYAFFLLQPFLTGLFLYRLLATGSTLPVVSPARVRLTGSVFWIAITGVGACLVALGQDRHLYLGLILAWAAPVLAGLWAYGGPLFFAYRRQAALAVAVPTAYLWIIDRVAIGLGIWDISDAYSLNIDPLGLPIEEAVFFLVTNVLVVCGGLLFLFGDRLDEPQRATQVPAGRSEGDVPA